MTTDTIEGEAEEETNEIPSTDEVVASMLTENTGAHMLDSGGAYGRNWEKHQGKTAEDFWDEDEFDVDIRAREDGGGEVLVTLNIFHYMAKMLEYTERSHDLTQQMMEFADEEMEGEPWLSVMREFTKGRSENTYNRETILSQTLQYCAFSLRGPFEEKTEEVTIENAGRFNDEVKVIQGTPVKVDGMWYMACEPEDIYSTQFMAIQVHGGCDVRGGYTAPIIFEVPDIEYWYLAENDVHARCERCGSGWHSDDGGYHWYGNMNNEDGDTAFKFVETDNDDYGSDKVIHKTDHEEGSCDGEIRFSATADY